MRPDVLTRHVLRRFNLKPQRIAIEGERRRQILDSNTDVIQYSFHINYQPTARCSKSFAAV